MKRPTSTPDSGDVIWIDGGSQAGHEQSGRRPALVLSPASYNGKVGLAVCCPVTSHVKGYPFEVGLPEGLPVRGVVLADQLRSLDWRSREASFACTVPDAVLAEVRGLVAALLQLPD